MPSPSRHVTAWLLQLLVTELWIFRDAEAVATLQPSNAGVLHAVSSQRAARFRSPVSDNMTTGINLHLQQRRANGSSSPGDAALQTRAAQLVHQLVAAGVHATESSNSSWVQPSGMARTDVTGQSTNELLQRFPQDGSDATELPTKTRGHIGETVEDDVERERRRELFFGLPKIFWALLADVVAMGIFVVCIPLTLYVAKRRRPAQPSSS